ncbi:MAG: RNA polymerase sporulation sigma factor SigE [Clostridiales bacterium]|nr:RNA polymerase sporulation sigma factor SigE [Clostridiales bacterium]
MRVPTLSRRAREACLRLRLWLRRAVGLPAPRIDYINGSDTLPPPLTREEETALLARFATGDTSVRNRLIEHNLRLVVYIARKYESTGIGLEDLISIGTIGLIKAIGSFQPSKGIKLATYASRCIENEILMYIRKNQNLRFDVSIDEPLNVDWDGNELLLSDILGTEGDVTSRGIEEREERELLHAAIARLGDRERKIMEFRFGMQGEEKTQKDVADLLGISQSYISRLEKKIISKLRKEIGKSL